MIISWSADQYLRYEAERNRPLRDLLAAVRGIDVHTAVDIGCGPGNSTEILAERFPDAAVSGMDTSEDMLAAARKRLPQVTFERADIASWQPALRFDLILANAVLQWLPDHASLLPGLIDKLTPGGCIAVQLPDNLDEPAHQLMRAVAEEPPWRERLAATGGTRASVASPAGYYQLLRTRCSHVEVWRTVYFHPLADGAEGIVEWFKGSGLRPYLEGLGAGERPEFLARYRAAVAQAYPPLPDGSVLLPFPRLFMLAKRQA